MRTASAVAVCTTLCKTWHSSLTRGAMRERRGGEELELEGVRSALPQKQGSRRPRSSKLVHAQPVSISIWTACQYFSVSSRFLRPEVGRNCKPGSKRRSCPVVM